MTKFKMGPILKQSADDNFKYDENSKKFSKRVENTVGKAEIARYEQFLLFPQCFQKACFLEASKGVIVWELDNDGICVSKDRNIAGYQLLIFLFLTIFSKTIFPQNLVTHRIASLVINPLPNNKFLDCSKLKAFADDKINVT